MIIQIKLTKITTRNMISKEPVKKYKKNCKVQDLIT